jgi:hypothetical protein
MIGDVSVATAGAITMPAVLFGASLYLISKISKTEIRSTVGLLDALIRIAVNVWSCIWLAASVSRAWDGEMDGAYLSAVYSVGVAMFIVLLLLLAALPLMRGKLFR